MHAICLLELEVAIATVDDESVSAKLIWLWLSGSCRGGILCSSLWYDMSIYFVLGCKRMWAISQIVGDDESSGCLWRFNKITYTFGPKQIPIFSASLFCKKLKSKQYYHHQNEIFDSVLYTVPLALLTIEDLLASPLSKIFAFAANDYRHCGSFTEMFVTAFHPFFLKAKSEANK